MQPSMRFLVSRPYSSRALQTMCGQSARCLCVNLADDQRSGSDHRASYSMINQARMPEYARKSLSTSMLYCVLHFMCWKHANVRMDAPGVLRRLIACMKTRYHPSVALWQFCAVYCIVLCLMFGIDVMNYLPPKIKTCFYTLSVHQTLFLNAMTPGWSILLKIQRLHTI